MTEKRQNVLLAAVVTILCLVVTGILFDYYYALNDDVLIKDILAGVQTGTPSGYSVQMLYPISVFISFFYRMFRTVPWYGVFLCFCHFGCLYLLMYRSLFLVKGRKEKALLLTLGVILIAGLLWWELVYTQYTVTAALLSGTATFWLYMAPAGMKNREFFKYHSMSILLMIIAFSIRTEMFLLLLPMMGIAGIGRWMQEENKRTALRNYLLVAGIVLAGMGSGLLLHSLAYSTPEWKEFNRFFGARTEVYDFYGIPDYEEHRTFYEEAGISVEQYVLLENYNFGMDDRIDASLLERVEDYAGDVYKNSYNRGTRFRESLWVYIHGLVDSSNQYFQGDYPWNIVVILSYLLLGGIAFFNKKGWIYAKMVFLFGARSISWMYILYRGRVPERISHSLYLVEFLILLAMLIEAGRGSKGKIGVVKVVLTAVLGLFVFVQIPSMYEKIEREQVVRIEKNRPYQALREYCKENPEQYYYVDVMSTVDFSEKMFEKTDNSQRNYDIIGGWLCKSPLSSEEEVRYFITEVADDMEWFPTCFLWERIKEIKKEDLYWFIYEVKK